MKSYEKYYLEQKHHNPPAWFGICEDVDTNDVHAVLALPQTKTIVYLVEHDVEEFTDLCAFGTSSFMGVDTNIILMKTNKEQAFMKIIEDQLREHVSPSDPYRDEDGFIRLEWATQHGIREPSVKAVYFSNVGSTLKKEISAEYIRAVIGYLMMDFNMSLEFARMTMGGKYVPPYNIKSKVANLVNAVYDTAPEDMTIVRALLHWGCLQYAKQFGIQAYRKKEIASEESTKVEVSKDEGIPF